MSWLDLVAMISTLLVDRSTNSVILISCHSGLLNAMEVVRISIHGPDVHNVACRGRVAPFVF